MGQTLQAFSQSLADAESGCPEAQYNIGLMYATGRGAPQDNVLAHMWFNLAAVRGDARARQERTQLSLDMSAGEIAQAQRLARQRLAPLAA